MSSCLFIRKAMLDQTLNGSSKTLFAETSQNKSLSRQSL